MFEPARFQYIDPERGSGRRFKAHKLEEATVEDMVLWFGAVPTETGVTLPSGTEAFFGDWIVCQEGMYLRVEAAEFESSVAPA